MRIVPLLCLAALLVASTSEAAVRYSIKNRRIEPRQEPGNRGAWQQQAIDLAHRAGGQFSRWLLEEAVGRSCSAHDDWQTAVTMLRYDAAVFCGPEHAA